MQRVEVKVVIDQNGNTTTQVFGMKGKKCVDLTRPLVEALGRPEDAQVKRCSEYYANGERVVGQAPLRTFGEL